MDSSTEVKTSPDVALVATTIIIIGEMIPADTRASPKMRPPRMDTAEPTVEAILVSLSLKISNEIVISKASTKAGNATF